MEKKKLPYQRYNGIYTRNRWIEQEKAKVRAKDLEDDIVKARHEKKYPVVYEKIDELKRIFDSYGNLFEDRDIVWLKNELIATLIQENESRIKKEFEKKVDNARLYYTIYDYKSSKYHGTYEQYVESRAIDSILEETSRYRYGGYMHVVIMRVLTPEYREKRRREIMQKRASARKQKGIEPWIREDTRSIIERVRKNFNLDYEKDK